jgi:hypothetical protein
MTAKYSPLPTGIHLAVGESLIKRGPEEGWRSISEAAQMVRHISDILFVFLGQLYQLPEQSN